MPQDFPFADGAYEYRPLRIRQPRLIGWDIFALQSALNACDIEPAVMRDGYFGKLTENAVIEFQTDRKLDVDGIAGVATQQKLCSAIARKVTRNLGLIGGLIYGGVEHESSCWIGVYTAPYTNGSRDVGPVQWNLGAGGDPRPWFDVAGAIQAYGRHVKDATATYLTKGLSDRRAAELAVGRWHRPAYTDALADGKDYAIVNNQRVDLSPGSPLRNEIEDYIDDVTAYVVWPE
jgi:peptidoglycan hydrolase-like protein with peptidoglycan-binding domain